MQLWVGLGNPGPKYAMHRHNVGFMAADVIADFYDFPAPAKKFQGWIQEGRIGSQRILLLKPATFMNESRSEEHTSELQSLMRISYAVFCLKKKNNKVSHH